MSTLMSTTENLAVTQRFFDAYQKGDLDAALAQLAPGFVAHYPGTPGPVNRDTFRQLGALFLSAFPDFEGTIEEQIAAGERVVTRQSYRGTHQGEFNGIPPTGGVVAFTSITIDRLAEGKIAERWVQYDLIGLFQQLGAIPAPRS